MILATVISNKQAVRAVQSTTQTIGIPMQGESMETDALSMLAQR